MLMYRRCAAAAAVLLGSWAICGEAAADDVDLTTISRVEQSPASPDTAGGGPFYTLTGDAPPARVDRSALLSRWRAGHLERHPTCRSRTQTGGAAGVGIGIVAGRIADAAGQPAPGIALRVMGRGKILGATSDPEGRYRLVLDQGEYVMALEPPGAAPARVIRVSPGTPVELDFVLPGTAQPSGTSSTVR